ncbi:MAG: SRPBCC family protein [Pseudomonadales bacterium]|nr:SRPBCC family protein [Pseudomonadales bacterium]
MAHHTEKTLRVKVPAAKIWEVLGDFSSVERFATTIKTSPIVNEKNSGLGAKRKCTFHDGSSLVEEIVDFQEGQGYKMELSEYSLPLKSMVSEMRVKEVDANTSELYMSTDFVVKGGPLGWLMGSLVMRPVMKGVFQKLLSGLAYHSVTGKRIEKEMPPKEELDSLVLG